MQSLEARIADRKKRRQLETKKRNDVGIAAEGEIDLSKLKKADLITYANEHNIDISEAKTNADIIAAIEAADEDEVQSTGGGKNPWNQ